MNKKHIEENEGTIPGKIDQFIAEKKEEIDALKKLLRSFEEGKSNNE